MAHPAYHDQGLIPFCQNNPHLRIQRQIGCCKSLHFSGWPHLNAKDIPLEGDMEWVNFHYILKAMVDWICEIECLAELGMLSGSFSTTFNARSNSDLQAWMLLRKAAK